MATTTAPVSDPPQFQIVNKIDSIPVVHDSVTYAHGLINSYPLGARLYETAVGVASKGYDAATPVLTRTKPLLESVDGLAVATFDRAASTFPYPFTTPTSDLPGVQKLTDLFKKTAEVNSALGARVHGTVAGSQDLAQGLFEQLRGLAESGAALPHALSERAVKVSGEVRDIIFAKEGTVQEKGQKFTAYAIDQAKPLIDEIYTLLHAAKVKAGEEGDHLAAEAQSVAEDVNTKVDGAKADAAKAAEGVKEDASKKVDEANKKAEVAKDDASKKANGAAKEASSKTNDKVQSGAQKTAEKADKANGTVENKTA
ncbi:hypothetical protein L202_00666 [Cryptococcus amylolentus CBS 6039]|uniref:Uncharacterized protein n=2 Tax=Cryptococcus amylolentus TaxID=104669 RepID=A0A1E3IAA4_9TREE|nr:hypothetical protein L202_00666 [Cryptococcus amylolentus CBS 6039]ODN84796.1 hypothetical protein L202_00666 [Cryptococcus amylolentus CBS 6039]ODO11479.1 hypothetical protein I350_00259 [Cryptococcus amylolentus CBS 6273]